MALTEQQQQSLLGVTSFMFDYAPDQASYDRFASILEQNPSFYDLGTDLAKTDAFQSQYDGTTQGLIDLVFGRLGITEDTQAYTRGTDFITQRLDAGVSEGQVLMEVGEKLLQDTPPEGLEDAAAILQNKIAVSQAYLESGTEGYSSDTLPDLLSDVTADQASVEAAQEKIDNLPTPSGGEGETFSLTQGVDTPATTSGDDTINALPVNATTGTDVSTLSAFDDIDGGAGRDTLNIYTTDTENADLPSSASVQNVEVVNIFNAEGAATDFADASNFEGVEQLWQIGEAAANVTNLEESTTAGFRNTAQATLNVAAVATAASATVALDNVADADLTDGNAPALNVAGDALNSVTVDGTIAAGTNDPATQSLTLDVTTGDGVTALTVETAVDATLTITDADNDVTAIDASASAGGVTFAGDADVSELQFGAGDDTVTLNTALSTTVTAASVSTGEGDDVITLNTTGDGDVTANAGAGDDTVIVSAIDALSTGSMVDGGEGVDTLSTDGGALAAEDYTLLNNVFTNFEELTFSAASEFDAARLSDYSSFTLTAGTTNDGVTNVADDQALTTADDLTATADGYEAVAGEDTVYAGNLDVTTTADAAVTANAESVDLTVNATAAAANSSTLDGDVQEATVSVNNYVEEDDASAFLAADVTVTTTDSAALDALTSLTLSGDGAATVTNGADTDLVTVDASGLDTVDGAGDAITGLTYTSDNAAAETISLGDGVDGLTMNASTVENTDSITGFNVAENDSDTLSFGTDADSDSAVTFEQMGEVEANSLELALVDVASSITAGADNAAIFDFGGDSYLFQDSDANGQVDDTDALLQLVGGVDQQMFVDNAIA